MEQVGLPKTVKSEEGRPIILLGFLLVWLVLNLLQAGLTELDPDEAYYFMYSRDLAWGYFDHPPVIALMIRLGRTLFSGELGVRFCTVALELGTFYLIWILAGRPLQKRDQWLLVAMIASMPMLQIYGFIATPDGPLLFFATWFFLLYQAFVKEDSWKNTLLLGLCMSLMLYSKYHGVLLILLFLASNPSLLLNPRFYIASVFGALLFLPHLYWQYANDFPSLRYHFFGRNSAYVFKNTTWYLANQLLILNPFFTPIALWAIWKFQPTEKLHRGFYFIMVGFWSFFLLTTYKGHAEPQWTAILSIPVLLITFWMLKDREKLRKWIMILSLVSGLIFILARIVLVVNVFNIPSEFHRSDWIYELQEKAEGHPVVFQDTYRDAGKYTFYTGEDCYTFADVLYRKNQYDIWDLEKEIHDKRALIVGAYEWDCFNCETVFLTRKTYKIKWADSLQVTKNVTLNMALEDGATWDHNREVRFEVEIDNPYQHTVNVEKGSMPIYAKTIFLQRYDIRDTFTADLILEDHPLIPSGKSKGEISFMVPDSLFGSFLFGMGLSLGDLPPPYSSQMVKVEVQ